MPPVAPAHLDPLTAESLPVHTITLWLQWVDSVDKKGPNHLLASRVSSHLIPSHTAASLPPTSSHRTQSSKARSTFQVQSVGLVCCLHPTPHPDEVMSCGGHEERAGYI